MITDFSIRLLEAFLGQKDIPISVTEGIESGYEVRCELRGHLEAKSSLKLIGTMLAQI